MFINDFLDLGGAISFVLGFHHVDITRNGSHLYFCGAFDSRKDARRRFFILEVVILDVLVDIELVVGLLVRVLF